MSSSRFPGSEAGGHPPSDTRGVRSAPGFETLELRSAYSGRVARVLRGRFRMPGGAELAHEVVELPDVVAVVPLLEDSAASEPRVVLVEQLRPAAGGFIHEIPAGHIDEGEEPEESARRELAEETGYTARTMEPMAVRFTLPGVSRQLMHYFLARELEAGPQRLDPSECLAVREFPLGELLDEILEGAGREPRVVDAKTHLGLLHAGFLWRAGRLRGSAGRSSGQP